MWAAMAAKAACIACLGWFVEVDDSEMKLKMMF